MIIYHSASFRQQILLNFLKFFSTKLFKYNGTSYVNHNRLLGKHGDILIDGIKTGYVAASGYNIAVSAKSKNNHLIIVVLGGANSKDRDSQAIVLAQKGFTRLNHSLTRSKKSEKYGNKAIKISSQLESMQKSITLDQSDEILEAYRSRIKKKLCKNKKGEIHEKCKVDTVG